MFFPRSIQLMVSATFAVIAALSARGEVTYQVVKALPVGHYPAGGLVQSEDGFLYGMTREGGRYKGGTIYRVAPGGVIEWLHHFQSVEFSEQPNIGGSSPTGKLVPGLHGHFYGLTQSGGALGYGTLFVFHPTRGLTTLHDLSGLTTGKNPSSLLRTQSGALYGLTPSSGPGQGGAIFRYTAKAGFETVHIFRTGTFDPNFPSGDRFEPSYPLALAEAADGTLFGLSLRGGPVTRLAGPGNSTIYATYGTAFRVETSRQITVIHEYSENSEVPLTLFENPGGALYGATRSALVGLERTGDAFNLHSLTAVEGQNPDTFFRGRDGSFYGSARLGGQLGTGTVFQTNVNGDFTTLFHFPADPYGIFRGEIAEGRDGYFYGIARSPGPIVPAPPRSVMLNGVFRLGVTPNPTGNESPFARGEAVTLPVSGKLSLNVLRNDKDPNRDRLSILSVRASPELIVSTIAGSPTLSIIASQPLERTVFIDYTVGDARGGVALGTVAVRPRFAGSYRGTISGEAGPQALSWSLNAAGLLTGAIKLDGVTVRVRGQFDTEENFTGVLGRRGDQLVTARLSVKVIPGQLRRITGTISFDDATRAVTTEAR